VAIDARERPDGLILDVTGLGPLFCGETALTERVVREFHDRRLSVRVAIADTPGAAWAAARFLGSPTSDLRPPTSAIIPPGTSLSALAPLPVTALRLPEETVELLAAVGIHSIGQLAALPRASLSARFGPQLLEHLDWVTGQAPELLVPHRAAPEFAAEWPFETPIDSAEAIERVLDELIRRVCHRLAERDQGALGFVCRVDCADRSRLALPIGLFRPSAAAKHLSELLKLRWETVRLAAPVSALAIEVTAIGRLPHEQQEFFAPDRSRDAPRHLASLVERLSSRLGREAVVRPMLLPDAQPEYASVDLPWTDASLDKQPTRTAPSLKGKSAGKRSSGKSSPVKSRTAPPGVRPIWLAESPIPLSVISVVPAGPPAQFHFDGVDYRVARTWGPERIETGWWRAAQRTAQVGARRDYYRVETTTGRRFWLFRRLADARWFCHGEFG
jgi:protein ImuB